MDIHCSHCNFSMPKEDAERFCSNCFACTGCIKYRCPKCNAEIVEVPVQSFNLKKNTVKPDEQS